MGLSTTKKLRPLNIKFEIYSDSEDNDFKSELVSLMAGSVQELQAAAMNAFSSKNSEIFKKAAHKAKSTLVLLDDSEFFNAVEDFKSHLIESESTVDELCSCKINKLNEICESIVGSLEREAEHLRQS